MRTILVRLTISLQTAVVLALAGCATTQTVSPDFITEGATLKRAGIPNVEFHSSGQMMNLNYFPYPRSTRLKLIEGKPHFRDESLQFLFSTAESFVFCDASLNSEITISIDRGKGTMQANETGGLYFRAWKSSADAREFSEWSQRFRELGFSSNRFGFVPQTKFIDGTRTDLRREERSVFVLEVRGNTVFWDGEAVTLSVVTMENNSLAVELAKQGSTFWLYGGGNFQVNSPGATKTVYVGSSARPTGSTISGSVPQPYVDLYPKLKAMAQAY